MRKNMEFINSQIETIWLKVAIMIFDIFKLQIIEIVILRHTIAMIRNMVPILKN